MNTPKEIRLVQFMLILASVIVIAVFIGLTCGYFGAMVVRAGWEAAG